MGKTAAQQSRVYRSVAVVHIPISGESSEHIPIEMKQTNTHT